MMISCVLYFEMVCLIELKIAPKIKKKFSSGLENAEEILLLKGAEQG